MIASDMHTLDNVTGPHEAIDSFRLAEFCMANRPTAWSRRGPASQLLTGACERIWAKHAFRLDQVCKWQGDASEKRQCREAAARIMATRPEHPPEIDRAEWHLPVDSDTVDDALRHCGVPTRASSEWTNEERVIRHRVEWALICERNEQSPIPGGTGVAIKRRCKNEPNVYTATMRLVESEGGHNAYMGTCLRRHLENQLPGQRGYPLPDTVPSQ